MLEPLSDRRALLDHLAAQGHDRDTVEALLKALDTAGLAVVPREPSLRQVRAGGNACSCLSHAGVQAVYRAAVDMSPFA